MASAQQKKSKKPSAKSKVTTEKNSVKQKNVKFELAADSGSQVFIAGSFNDWNPEKKQLKEKNGIYSATVRLPIGKHEYKFIVNGVWCLDPNCEEWAPNGLGSINSVIEVA